MAGGGAGDGSTDTVTVRLTVTSSGVAVYWSAIVDGGEGDVGVEGTTRSCGLRSRAGLLESEEGPSHLGAPEDVGLTLEPRRDGQTCRRSQPHRLVRGNLEHAAAGWDGTMTERQQHDAARPQEARDARHGATTLRQVQMHPHRREHDDVEPNVMR